MTYATIAPSSLLLQGGSSQSAVKLYGLSRTPRFVNTGALSRVKRTPSPERKPFKDAFFDKPSLEKDLEASPRLYAASLRSSAPQTLPLRPATSKRLGPGVYDLSGSAALRASSSRGGDRPSRVFLTPARDCSEWQIGASAANPDTSDVFPRDKTLWRSPNVYLPSSPRFAVCGLYSTQGVRAMEIHGMKAVPAGSGLVQMAEASANGRRPAFRPEAADAAYQVNTPWCSDFSGTISQSVEVSPVRYAAVFSSAGERLAPLPRSRALAAEPASVQTCSDQVGPQTYEPYDQGSGALSRPYTAGAASVGGSSSRWGGADGPLSLVSTTGGLAAGRVGSSGPGSDNGLVLSASCRGRRGPRSRGRCRGGPTCRSRTASSQTRGGRSSRNLPPHGPGETYGGQGRAAEGGPRGRPHPRCGPRWRGAASARRRRFQG